jgi:hypothetical protein
LFKIRFWLAKKELVVGVSFGNLNNLVVLQFERAA